MDERGKFFNIVMIADEEWKRKGQPEVCIIPPTYNLQEVLDDVINIYSSRKGAIFIEEHRKPATKFGLTENCGR